MQISTPGIGTPIEPCLQTLSLFPIKSGEHSVKP